MKYLVKLQRKEAITSHQHCSEVLLIQGWNRVQQEAGRGRCQQGTGEKCSDKGGACKSLCCTDQSVLQGEAAEGSPWGRPLRIRSPLSWPSNTWHGQQPALRWQQPRRMPRSAGGVPGVAARGRARLGYQPGRVSEKPGRPDKSPPGCLRREAPQRLPAPPHVRPPPPGTAQPPLHPFPYSCPPRGAVSP